MSDSSEKGSFSAWDKDLLTYELTWPKEILKRTLRDEQMLPFSLTETWTQGIEDTCLEKVSMSATAD